MLAGFAWFSIPGKGESECSAVPKTLPVKKKQTNRHSRDLEADKCGAEIFFPSRAQHLCAHSLQATRSAAEAVPKTSPGTASYLGQRLLGRGPAGLTAPSSPRAAAGM